MNTITGANLITINAQAGEAYRIEYESAYSVNILNQTDGTITVSPDPEYREDSVSSECLKLTADAFYYDLYSRLGNSLYITAEGDGYISVIRKDR